jgi:hypothetical protein
MIIYLYVKTHNKTGLKYLGQTTQDPYLYKGSGTRWTNHLKVHGRNISTEILHECSSKEELKELGIYYSNLWDIVSDPMWANCTIEEGSGGKTVTPESRTGSNNPMFGKKNPCSDKKRIQLIKTKTQKNYEKYVCAIKRLLSGERTSIICKELNIKRSQLSAIKRGKHGIFEAFPELSEYQTPLSVLPRMTGTVPNMEIYQTALTLIADGLSYEEINKQLKMEYNRRFTHNILNKLRDGSHRIFSTYPILCKFKTC